MDTLRVLPTPWVGGGPDIDVPALLQQLDAGPATPERRDLATALRYAVARRADADSTIIPARIPGHLLLAQLVLDVAVEWRMPAVERWAVAWLEATGRPYLRTRWSSRSRDGRERRDRRSSDGVVTATAAAGPDALIGTRQGLVSRWTAAGDMEPLATLPGGGAVLAVAGDGGRVVAVGQHGALASAGWPEATAPVSPEHRANLVAVHVGGPTVCCGAEDGRVYRWDRDRGWSAPVLGHGVGRVVALTLRAGSVVAVWADGTIARLDDEAQWTDSASLGAEVAVAAWDERGERLAYALADDRTTIRVDGTPVWRHRGVHAVAWSADGQLASAGSDDLLRIGRPGNGVVPDVLRVEEHLATMAFTGESFLVTAAGDHLTQWDLSLAGSDDPALMADAVTAVGLRGTASEDTLVGTESGRLVIVRGDGSTAPDQARVPGPVHRVAAQDGAWLIAAGDGAYRWTAHQDPPQKPRQLSLGVCNAVAVRRGRALYTGETSVYFDNGERLTLMDHTVADVAVAGDGTVAVLDVWGTLRIIDARDTVTDLAAGNDDLIAAVPGGALTLRWDAEPRVRAWAATAAEPVSQLRLTAVPRRLVPLSPDDFAGAYERGTAVVGRRGGHTAVIAATLVGSELVASLGNRVVAADGTRLTGYDLRRPDAGTGNGRIAMTVTADDDRCRIVVGESGAVELDTVHLRRLLAEASGETLRAQAEAVFLAGVLGDRLWHGGLGIELDRARGDDPDRPVRIDLALGRERPAWLADVAGRHRPEIADLPWELLHRRSAPLPWFTDPPITVIRTVPDAPARALPPSALPALLVLRDTDEALSPVDAAYEEIRRRTRLTAIRLVHGRPVTYPDEASADVVHLWAHAGPDGVEINGRRHSNEDVAQTLTAKGARFVVLVGCSSATLARLLVTRGVDAVVGMRTEVYNRTVVPLVEHLTTAVLRGEAVDRAFAAALRQYVLTGQPGAAAVPVLYMRAGASGVIFRGERET